MRKLLLLFPGDNLFISELSSEVSVYFNFIKTKVNVYTCEYFVNMYECSLGTCLVPVRSKKRELELLELQLLMVVSYQVGAGN